MSKIYKMIEIVGTSPTSFAEATRSAIEEASRTVKAMGWFEVERLGGRIQNGKVSEFQAKVKVGFRLLGPGELK
ncbi:MAG: dodecin family protein [bacterium]|nr:dodecin family protein [bacterium]